MYDFARRKVVVYSLAAMFAVMHDTVVSPLRAQEADVIPRRLSPVFSTTEVYDSNVFSTSTATTGDFITRVSPGLEGEYHTPRFSLLGRSVFDLERFAANPELSTAGAGQHAAINVRTDRSRRLAFALDAAVERTRTPGELSVVTGLTLARARAQHVEVHPAIVRQVNPVTEATVDYTWTDDRLAGGVATSEHRAGLAIDRHVSRRDVVDLRYGVRMFLFDRDDRLTSHAVSLGWSREITREAHLELRGGPVLTDGRPAPEVLASLRYAPGPSELSVTYARTQTTLIGVASVLDTQSMTASAARMLPKRLRIRITPGLFRTTSETLRADAARVTVEADRPVTDQVALRTTYEAAFQRGRSIAAPFANSISRHLVQFSVVAAPARRRPDGR
jgi:hypothetical protein